MELRRRRQRKRPVQLTELGSAIIATLLIILIVAGVYFSKAGDWLSTDVFSRLFETKEQRMAAVNPDMPDEETSSSVTRRITFPAQRAFTLQMGVFEDYDNALSAALELRSRGAAGYLLEEGGKYRVLASAYPTEEKLKLVRDRLTAGGVISAAYTVSADGAVLSATGSEDQLARYAAAADCLFALPEKLYALAMRFDEETTALEEGRQALSLLEDSLKEQQGRLSGVTDENDPLDCAIRSCFDTLIESMDDAVTGAALSRASFSAQLKWLHLFSLDQCGRICRLAAES